VKKSPRSRKIVLGVTGSIAAYKSAELVRALTKAGHEVRCVMTPAAAHFVTPLTLSTLSKNPVAQNLYDPSLWEMAHLTLADWADLIVVAPCTADFLARLASGRAEGVLDGLILAARVPVALCPAMDGGMWEHPATRANTAKVKSFGYKTWGPVKGELASGKTGMGRMLEPQEIAERVASL
jgi:phosphopantothenoylcysteine decarboxylase/phosphopantothenate--cysteine ligase